VRAVVLGPLAFDAWLLKRAMGGVVYKSVYMDMVLLGRRNGDVRAIEAAYYRAHGKHLVEGIKSELGGPVEALFRNAIEARRQDENAPVVEAAVEKDVVDLYTAMVGSVEAHVVAEILVTRSDAQIRRITELYNSKYGVGKEKKLEDVIVKKFKGHMEDALLYIVQGANNKALRDARMLERTMKGVGMLTLQILCYTFICGAIANWCLW
jgi:annexin A7/11